MYVQYTGVRNFLLRLLAVRDIVSIQTSSKKNPTYHREE